MNARSANDTEPTLHRKLVWITFFRLVVVTVLLGATAVLTFSERDSLTSAIQVRLYGLTVGVYLASLAYLALMRFGRASWLPAVAYLQVAGDVALAAFLVWLTGGGESIFSFLFSLGIINGAILRYRVGALVAAVASALAFAAITLAMQWGVLAPAAAFVAPQALPFPRLVFTLFINAAGFVLVAVLASYLSEQERKTGKRLTEAEEGFAALAALHERIVQSVASGILTLDGAGRVTFLNRSGEELLGGAGTGLRGRALRDTLPELQTAVASAREEGATRRGEVAPMIDGEPRQLGFTVTPLAPVGGEAGGWVVVFQDLTTLRQMEEMVRRNERLAAVGVLAAGLAHEIRNPLASMSGSVELLRAELPTGADEARLMDIVLRETDRLDRLITDFLSFARPAPPRFGEVSFSRLMREALEVFENDPAATGCEVEAEIDEDTTAWGDEGQLRRALLNLLLNAAQAMEGGGRIRVGLSRSDAQLRLHVEDEGPGISEGDLDRIFDPFYTTRERGSGLGLALVHRTVESHGGHIEVKSSAGAGSRFTLVLPIRSILENQEALQTGS
jgi:two-component system, NtrC family, sensor histidine kinase PilS